jgi:hypothetical protein
MRKIEAEMLSAIAKGINWQKGNTRVTVGGMIYLHDNLIAFTCKDGTVYPVHSTLLEWPTNTTRSRLRALGFTVKGDTILA